MRFRRNTFSPRFFWTRRLQVFQGMSTRKRFHANIRKSDLSTVTLEWNVTQKLDPTLQLSNYKQLPKIRMFFRPQLFVRDGPELLHTCSTCMSIPRPYLLTSGGCFSFSPNIFGLTSYVRIRACMSRRRVQNHKRVWELHTSAATPPSLLFSVASTTNLVGHNMFAFDRHKNIKF